MVASRLRHVELPHDKKERWLKLKDLYSELEGVQTANDLAVTLQRIFEEANNDTQKLARERSKDAVDSFGPNWHFKGLEVFLEEIATREESETFFKTTLPFIVTLASSIEEFAPSEGILLCSQLQESGVVLDRRFIACVLASAFLCALPPPPDGTQVRSINFVHLYACFHREDVQQTQAAKLRCLIHYFERLCNEWPDIGGRVFYCRQVIPSKSLPTLDDWMSCDLPLCPVIVDNETSIECSGEHMLQVDFANRYIGGGALGAGHVQEEIRFCINPELLVALLFMEAMQDNESIMIRGVERFSSYSGYGKTFEFAGDFKDESQRDENGDFLTTVVAIDATQFKNAPREAQYEESALMRELNKALVGFYNPEVGSQVIQTQSDDDSNESFAGSVNSSGDLVVSLEDLVASSEETGSSMEQSLTQDVPKIQEFSEKLVDLALSQALDEVKSNKDCALFQDVIDGDVVTKVMKKSLIEVFGGSPEKARVYSESLLRPSPIPKCLSRNISGSSTPLVPGTPPSSPAIYDLEQTSFDSDRLRNTLCLDTSPAKGAALSLSAKSFADSLSNSLMSCIELTSSLATAIATTATSPGHVAAGTKEVFQKSPKKLGSPVKNGDSLISFLTRKVSKPETPPRQSYSNGFNMSEFVEDLSSLVSSAKVERFATGKDRTDSCVEIANPKQNLLEEFDRIDHVVKRKESDEKFYISDAKLFESLATKLSSLIIESAIQSSIYTKDERNEHEMDAVDFVDENKPLVSDTGNTTTYSSSSVKITDNKDFSNILNGHVDSLLVETISSALVEAAEYCVEETLHEFSSSAVDGEEERVEKNGESDHNTREISALGESDVRSSESSEDEQSDLNEVDKFSSDNALGVYSSEVPETVVQTAEKLSQEIIWHGVTQASEIIKERSENATKEGERCRRDEKQLQTGSTEGSPSLSDEDVNDEQTLNEFAELLSTLTVCGAVKIAEASLEAPTGESRVRPVATGNWGCGVFKGDPELKAVIQWVAASAAGCPVVVYHTFGDRRMSRLLKALVCLHSRGWKISDVIQGVLRFCSSTKEERESTRGRRSLLSFLCHTPQTSL